MTTQDQEPLPELPPLPEGWTTTMTPDPDGPAYTWYDSDQMRAYAREALRLSATVAPAPASDLRGAVKMVCNMLRRDATPARIEAAEALEKAAASPSTPRAADPSHLERAVIDAAHQWWCERSPDDWDSAELAKALIRLNGDWEGCPECDHECDEPCMPATMEEQLRSVDCRIAQLVHEGKLHGDQEYSPPAGWQPMELRRPKLRPTERAPASTDELPGMWERADFEGGATEQAPSQPTKEQP